MHFRPRHLRWIAVLALLGLLFQQLAMAVYVCPLETGDAASIAATMLPCGSPDTRDTRCQQHCHPLAQSSDHAPALTVPVALLAATTWSRAVRAIRISLPESEASEIDAHATAPPLTVQHCTFQI